MLRDSSKGQMVNNFSTWHIIPRVGGGGGIYYNNNELVIFTFRVSEKNSYEQFAQMKCLFLEVKCKHNILTVKFECESLLNQENLSS